MGKILSILLTVFIIAAFLVAGNEFENEVEVQIQEWEVPWEDSRPRDPSVAPDGTIWFVGQRTHYVAKFDPETEEFSKFDLEEGAGPHTVVVDDQGNPWYAGNRANHIGKVNPENGEITKYMMPEDMSARDPHTMVFNDEGNIWFTSQGANSIGFFDVEKEEPTIIPVETERARPYGIIMDQDGKTPWAVLFGTNKLAKIDPDNMEIEEVDLPNEETRPRRLVQTSDGTIWYGDYARGFIGSYNPEDESVNEWEMPSGEDSRPYAVAVDENDRIWLVETGVDPNVFVGFDTAAKEFVSSTEIESGGGTVRHMVYDEQNNSIWFGTDTNYLGKAQIN